MKQQFKADLFTLMTKQGIQVSPQMMNDIEKMVDSFTAVTLSTYGKTVGKVHRANPELSIDELIERAKVVHELVNK
ncbi:hypothetical protein GTO89_04060 [Heliobacterium gestii]|uniref:Uncharacterized protein n=1 Tax=Heliomicrobium gestii TaxID=2699 RepID=A0A845LFB8_HELGE|nr:hypothetical protein [Heliomicrobium gestii]MBM7866784.1 hypothetical protein [Heliomicrobium gestii]MZP42213.1 hypothetical protein [Heliomicrobium gestii]